MNAPDLLDRIARGRTNLVFQLLLLPQWRTLLDAGETKFLQWFVYDNDVTALKAVLASGGDLASLDLDSELRHAPSSATGGSAMRAITTDHGAGWGYGMERNFLGDYLPESRSLD